jgi:hypothetical protein
MVASIGSGRPSHPEIRGEMSRYTFSFTHLTNQNIISDKQVRF